MDAPDHLSCALLSGIPDTKDCGVIKTFTQSISCLDFTSILLEDSMPSQSVLLYQS